MQLKLQLYYALVVGFVYNYVMPRHIFKNAVELLYVARVADGYSYLLLLKPLFSLSLSPPYLPLIFLLLSNE